MARIIGSGTPVRIVTLTGYMISTEAESGMPLRMRKVVIFSRREMEFGLQAVRTQAIVIEPEYHS
ncbi:MAG: hypothetical protein K8F53_14920 [Rhodocyclaceae bacterium]|nr:hypothetical protein [Rhodocyclaceae bacterium]